MQIAGWLLGPVRRDGVWHHARDARCAARRRRHVKTHFKNQSASEGGQLLSSALFFFFYLPPSSSICHSGKLALFRESVFSFICSSLAISLCVSSLPACFPLFILPDMNFHTCFFFFLFPPSSWQMGCFFCFFFRLHLEMLWNTLEEQCDCFNKWTKVLFRHFFKVQMFGVNYAETFGWRIGQNSTQLPGDWVSHDHNPNKIVESLVRARPCIEINFIKLLFVWEGIKRSVWCCLLF